MPIHVLYVDDELPHLMIAEEYLPVSGKITLTCVASGKEAIDALKADTYDVIVSDYMMQDMDGIELLIYVRAQFGKIPFLLFTGKGKEDVVIEALNNGADYYIRKAGEPEEQFRELEQRIILAYKQFQASQELAEKDTLPRTSKPVVNELIVEFRPDMIVTSANSAYARYYGKELQEVAGGWFLPDLPPEERKQFTTIIQNLTPGHPSDVVEFLISSPNGEEKVQIWQINGQFSHQGILTGCRAVGRDLTQKEAAREGLIHSEEQVQQPSSDLPRDFADFDENIPLNFIITNTHPIGVWALPELIRETKKEKMNGVAASTGQEGERSFIIFVNGSPEGGMYIDRNGALYGDKSVLFFKESQQYTMYPTETEIARRFVSGCRIFDQSHLRGPSSYDIPEISSTRKGIGIVTISLIQNGNPIQGMKVTVRSGGKIVGNDVTASNGQTVFQLLYGNYTGVVHTDQDIVKSFSFAVNTPGITHTVDISRTK